MSLDNFHDIAPQRLANNDDDWTQGINEFARAANGDQQALQNLKDRYEALTPLAKGEGGLYKLEGKNPFREITAPEYFGMDF